MKTNLLTLLIFAFTSVLFSCSKESDTTTQDSTAPLTIAERRIIISNCSSHSGCHSGARLNNAGSLLEANLLLGKNIDINHNLSICDRNKMQLWFNGEIN